MKVRSVCNMLRACALCCVALMLASCAGGGGGGSASFAAGIGAMGRPPFADPDYERTPPPLLLAEYKGENQAVRDDGGRSGIIDMTSVAEGYVAVSVTAPVQARFRVSCNGVNSDYVTNNTGDFEFFPLSLGDGYYTFTVFLNVSGDQYEYFLTGEANVALASEFAPFLINSQVVNYDGTSEVVSFSHELTQHASSELEVIQQIYWWITANVTYDTEKAQLLSSSSSYYVPEPDAVLATKRGICYDYAALAAAMLRINGIPCKLIKGYVETGEDGQVYHAWNLIWLSDGGQIVVGFSVAGNTWERIDLTFASSRDPSIAAFIGDGSNYYETYQY